MNRVTTKSVFGASDRSDTNWSVRIQMMAKGLKFRVPEFEELYYLKSETKGTDQLRINTESALLFTHMQKSGLLMMCLKWCC